MSTIWKALVVLCIVGLLIVGYLEYKLYTNTKALHAWVKVDFYPKYLPVHQFVSHLPGGPGEGSPPPPPPPDWK
jgi:hypothetical protein